MLLDTSNPIVANGLRYHKTKDTSKEALTRPSTNLYMIISRTQFSLHDFVNIAQTPIAMDKIANHRSIMTTTRQHPYSVRNHWDNSLSMPN